eukprot:CAMPEP_0194297894 /NCGR_PEP_ID=MMETSP0169-20130528/59863_1 /TAXON_ID=218684 /ORGANISM="Corethron pennatum, Strain L29A3" /LENGTH=226 /DNA_ID=CAMNT_0039047819 /DNA_START=638 /DNA_END=1318 /DNA_ORIENTATION=-
MLKLAVLSCLTVGASAFAPASSRTPLSVKTATSLEVKSQFGDTGRSLFDDTVFEDAMGEWNAEYPKFAKYGWGPSTKAERWNGRHAMFGWVIICASAYAHGNNLIPNANLPLDLKEWGTLATISGKNTISNERAVILIANVHALFVSFLAACAPTSFSDQLLLKDGEKDEEPYGLVPPLVWGLTPEAEVMNGRMAMMGLITLVATSAITQKPMIDVVNEWLGGLYY